MTVVKITRGGLGLDKIFVGFCQIHVKKLDKSAKICELLKHIILFLSTQITGVEEDFAFLSIAKCCIFLQHHF